jgi:hypothetical protein
MCQSRKLFFCGGFALAFGRTLWLIRRAYWMNMILPPFFGRISKQIV